MHLGRWPRLAWAALAGAIGAAAFAPLSSGLLQVASLAAALWLAQRPASGWRVRASIGFAWGLGQFVAGVCWLYVSMHRYGGMPSPMAAAAVVLFGGYLALYPAIAFALGGGTVGAGPARILAYSVRMGAAWTLGEWLRGWVFTGFPWLSIGYAHVDGPLAGFAPLLGVYGVGTLAATISAAIAAAAATPPALGRGRAIAIALAIALLPAAAGTALARLDWATPQGAPIDVRLVQGNVPQNLKFVREEILRAMQRYASLASARPADLTVLPETAWTVPWDMTPPQVVDALFARGAAQGAVAIGMPLPVPVPQQAAADPRGVREVSLSNSVALLLPQAPHEVAARYDKHHLVPFGEFVPPGFRWFVDMMHIPLGDFGRGSLAQPPFVVAGQRLAFNICYEDLFGEELLPSIREGATVLVNVSNIGWFGDSHALPQHLQIARMRTLETARPMLRATNTGMTASIDHRGRVLAALPPFIVGVLDARVQGTVGTTPYVRTGNWLAVGIALALLLVTTTLARRHSADSAPRS